jgi:Zn-dependent protease with chaperone function
VMAVLGWGRDHCASHGHHLHLCLLHSAGLRPTLAVIGALALAVFLFRAGALVHRIVRMRARLAALEALGTSRPGPFPVVLLPGAPRLCHAAGTFHRRILLSASIEEALPPRELEGALAHEEAHLRRRDPLMGLLLASAGLFMPPLLARAFLTTWQAASEEACDADAVETVGDSTLVASALVKMAALQQRASQAGAPAFGEVALERRIRLLLDGQVRGAMVSLALMAAAVTAAVTLLLALLHSSFLHHAVETALSLIS